jgi:hypothetical protein
MVMQYEDASIMERPSANEDSEFVPEKVPDSDAGRKPRDPKSKIPKVTPLDEDEKIKDGIEIKET